MRHTLRIASLSSRRTQAPTRTGRYRTVTLRVSTERAPSCGAPIKMARTMNKPDSRLEQFSGHAKRLVRGSEKMLQAAEQLEREVADNSKKVERYLSNEFSWSFLYELPQMQLCVLLLAALGQLDKFANAIKDSPDPNGTALDLMEAEMSDDTPVDWKGGQGGMFEEQDVLAVLMATMKSLVCLGLYGLYMPELVGQIKAGSDEALFKAIRIDRTAITCPSVAEFAARRLARAELFRDKRYLRRFLGAMNGNTRNIASRTTVSRFCGVYAIRHGWKR